MSDEKTEEPTDKKLRDARRDGEVSRSTDLSDAVSMSAAILLLVAAADHFGDAMRALVNGALAFVSADHSLVEMTARLYQFGGIALSAVMPLLFVAALAGIGGSVLQVGLQISLKPVMPNLGALNPAEGLKKLFSPRSAIESIKMIVKAVIVFCVAWKTIVWLFPLIAGALYQSPPELSRIFREILAKWLMVVAGLCLLMGAADVKLQRFMFMQKMKMTKDEVKRESKKRRRRSAAQGRAQAACARTGGRTAAASGRAREFRRRQPHPLRGRGSLRARRASAPPRDR